MYFGPIGINMWVVCKLSCATSKTNVPDSDWVKFEPNDMVLSTFCNIARFRRATMSTQHHPISQATLHPAARCTWANHSKVFQMSTFLGNLMAQSKHATGVMVWIQFWTLHHPLSSESGKRNDPHWAILPRKTLLPWIKDTSWIKDIMNQIHHESKIFQYWHHLDLWSSAKKNHEAESRFILTGPTWNTSLCSAMTKGASSMSLPATLRYPEETKEPSWAMCASKTSTWT